VILVTTIRDGLTAHQSVATAVPAVHSTVSEFGRSRYPGVSERGIVNAMHIPRYTFIAITALRVLV
jgi:hypothetical protein